MEWALLLTSVVLTLATIVLARATWAYAVAAKRQADAADNQAGAANQQVKATLRQIDAMAPRPYVYLRFERVGAAIMLVNGGDRVAHDVRLTVLEEAQPVAIDSQWLTGSRLAARSAPGIPPGGTVRESRDLTLLSVFSREDTVRFSLSYHDAEGREFEETCTYSLTEMNWLTGPPLAGASAAYREAGRKHAEIVGAIEGVSSAAARAAGLSA